MKICLLSGSRFASKRKPSRFVSRSLHLILLAVLSFFYSGVFAQQTVKGKVLTSTGALGGATVQVKGSTTATQTDANGNFSINAAGNATIVVSSVGYETREVPVNNRNSITIQLQTLASEMGEVVVVGYGTRKKVNLTGSVGTVDGEELNKRVVTNPASLLQGKLNGLSVIENSGEPGNEGIALRIRGSGTFSAAGNEPLVIIDGIPGSLSDLNPNDIENISVLKDAASASIYGVRAANGVILVTTKKGREGKFSLNYNFVAGVTSASRKLPLVTNSVEYMEMYNAAAQHSGLSSSYQDSFIDLYRNPSDPKYVNFDWQNYLFNTVTTQNHYLSASGGKGGTTYNVGLGYVDQPGVMKGFEFKKYTVQLGLNSEVNKKISFGTNLNLGFRDRKYPRQGAAEQYLAAITQAPMYGPYTSDGTGKLTNTNKSDPSGIFHNKNPEAVAEYVRALNRAFNLIGSAVLRVKFLKELTWESRGGLSMSASKTNDFRPVVPTYDYYSNEYTGNLDVGANGLTMSDRNEFNPMVYSQLTFDKDFGEHALTLLGGTQAEYNRTEYLMGYRKGFIGNEIRELDAGGADGQTTGGWANEYSLLSYYGRANYDYQQKYLLEANFRYDGSSRFAEENRWGLFPSFSAGWRVSRERFMENLSWLSELKLRGSWGKLGNQNIGIYPYQDILDVSSTYPLDNSGNVYNGALRTRLVDKNIRWETTRIFDLGADVGLFANKVDLTIDWFDKRTSDILRSAQIPAYAGVNPPTVNGGVLQNRGWEFAANYRNTAGNLHYTVGASFQTASNKLLKYGARDISNSSRIIEEGLPYRAYYIWLWDGVFQSQQEIDNSATQPFNPKPGDIKFKDVSGPDGKPDGVIDTYDRTLVDGAYAKYNYSLNFNLSYKRFDLTAFFYGVQGQKLYVQRWGMEPFTQGTAPTVNWRNAWSPDNHTNTLPALYVWNYAPMTKTVSTFFLQDASFFRIKNIQIGYNLPERLLDRIGIEEMRVFFSGDNLAVFTKYPYLDPERSPETGQNSTFAVYPQNRILSFGAHVKF